MNVTYFKDRRLTGQEQSSHSFLPLNKNLDGEATVSFEDRIFTVDALQCDIAGGAVVGVHTRVYVSFPNVV
jgi:hypothetical protein